MYITRVVRSPIYTVTNVQQLYFWLALILFLLVKATPLDIIGTNYLFSAHVLQLSVLYFIVIPLAILSLPTTLLRRFVWNHRMRFTVTLLANPWWTLIAFNGLLSIYLLPSVFHFIHSHMMLSILAQIILFINATFMWWVIIHPLPEIKGLSHLMRAFYIFLASLALFPIGFYFVIIQKPLFPIYLEVERFLIPGFTAIYDQQAAGGILKITQLGSYSVALLIILFAWARIEEKKEGTVDEEHIRYVRGVVVHLDKDKK